MSEWQPIETALDDPGVYAGDLEILILTNVGVTQARFCAGEWTENQEGREYDGAVWACCDDAWQIEIEECGHNTAEWDHGMATHWMPLPKPPLAA